MRTSGDASRPEQTSAEAIDSSHGGRLTPVMSELRHADHARYVEPGDKRLGLTTKDEQAWCRWFGAEAYSGRGAVVEWGAWLGSLTSSYCDGLLANPRRPGGTVAYAYDLFRWEQWCEDEVRGTEHAGRLRIGEPFADYFAALHERYRDFLAVRAADLSRELWSDGPIELIVNDAVKTLPIGKGAYAHFTPALLPGAGLIANQDYLWPTDAFIAVLHFLLRDFFAHEYTVPDSCMVVFRCRREPDAAPLLVLPDDLAQMDRALLDEAFAWSRRTVPVAPVEMIDLGKAVTLWQAGWKEDACRVVRDGRLAAKRNDPVYDFQLDVLQQWGFGVLLSAGADRS